MLFLSRPPSTCIRVTHHHIISVIIIEAHRGGGPLQGERRVPLLLGQLPVAGPQHVRRHLGLPLPREDALPVADDPVDLLLRHEVGKVPDHLAVQDALSPDLVEGSVVHGQQLRLVLLGEDEGRVLVQIIAT